MVHVQIYGQFKNKKFVENVSELLVENILPTNIRRPVSVDIWIYNALEEQAGGFCWGDKNTIEIELARTSDGHRFSREEMLINLTHELIHAKQFIAGELSPTTAKWKKADYSKHLTVSNLGNVKHTIGKNVFTKNTSKNLMHN